MIVPVKRDMLSWSEESVLGMGGVIGVLYIFGGWSYVVKGTLVLVWGGGGLMAVLCGLVEVWVVWGD